MSKIAIVHDFLTQFGGAERVAMAMAETFPDAPFFTSIYAPDSTYSEMKNFDVRTMKFIGHLPPKHFRFGAPLYGFGFEHLRLDEFDKVLVSSSVFAHHIRHDNAYIYCHTPPRFTYDLENCTSSRLLRNGARPLLGVLRARDVAASNRHDHYVANSKTTQRHIRECYQRNVEVINPPLDTRLCAEVLIDSPAKPRVLIVARLQPYKRVDLAIEACHRTGVGLTVVGSGPEKTNLQALANGKDVDFLTGLSDEELASAFSTHTLLVVPGIEDYGLTPLEANYSGRPVVGRSEGGVAETVTHGVNGLLVSGDDPETWAAAIAEALTAHWNPQLLRYVTIPFQMSAFQKKLRSWMGES